MVTVKFEPEHRYNVKVPGLRKNVSRCSSGVERFLGKEEVTGSNPVIGSIFSFDKK